MTMTGTVTGRSYTRTRPRGFVEWKPRAETRVLIDAVGRVLDDYNDQLPLTLRQVFYVLVGQHGYDKTEQAYSRLGEAVNRARRARLIDMDAIRDDGITSVAPGGFTSVGNFRANVRHWAERYERDAGLDQPLRVELWVEAAGMVPQAVRVAHPYGVPVFSSGGFDSTTAKHASAQRLADDPRQAVILHVGDHDPSGCAIIDSAADDVRAFVLDYEGIAPEFKRIAVTEAQVQQYNLPTAPQKTTDRRGDHMAATVQAEALPPDVLAAEIDQALHAWIDFDVLNDTRAVEQHERAVLLDELQAAGW